MATIEKQRVGRPRLFRKKQQEQLARELLEETADFLSEDGRWMVGRLHDGVGRHCAIGALISVSHRKKYRGSGVYEIARDMLYNAVKGKVNWKGMSKNHAIYTFNDSVARDETEVVRAFKEASAADE